MQLVGGLGILFVLAFILFLAGVRVLNEYERGVVFRLGRLAPLKGPGLKWIIPAVDRMVRTRAAGADSPLHPQATA